MQLFGIDSEGEAGETYDVYASRSAILKKMLKDAEVIEFGVLEDAQTANHDILTTFK